MGAKRKAGVSRRGFLAGAVATAALAASDWTPVAAVVSGSPASTLPVPPAFPAGIPLYQQAYENWSQEIVLDDIWTCAPRTPADVVTLVNWAVAHGYTIRPRGAMHGWTPLTIVNGEDISRVILADTMVHLNSISVNAAGSPATVTAGPGATLDAILTALQAEGLGWVSVPAPGVLSIAGALAVDAHGAALPAVGEKPIPGTTYGSLSNLITALTAVVWDATSGRYVLRTFTRGDRAITPLLTHLGRTFITSVTLQAGANYRLRCQSYTNIPWQEMFAPAGTSGRTFEKYVAASGRVEAIWFPFTDNPWLKVWTPTPVKPWQSREVTAPYNYTFSDGLPENVTDLIREIQLGNVSQTPLLGEVQYLAAALGLPLTDSADIWGWSKDLLFYIEPSTERLTEGGGAVITSRANIARVINEFTIFFHERVSYYQSIGQYPINGPVEIRCCGLDQPADVRVPSAGPPTISAMRSRPDHPEWDTAIWLNILSTPGTPGIWAFYREIEQWMFSHFSGSYATFRPEWSKGWAFTDGGPYSDATVITRTLPATYRAGVPASENWDTARAAWDALDPHRVFSNVFIDQLLP